MNPEILKVISVMDPEYDSIHTDGPYRGGWYLDGQLEVDLGHDIASFCNLVELGLYTTVSDKGYIIPKLDGTYQVKVHGINRECIGYFWETSEEGYIHGLVCYADDLEANKYAFSCMQNKESFI